MTEYISEIFSRIHEAKNRKLKKEILESCKDNKVFKFVLQGTFDPSIQWTVKKIPPYIPVVDRPLDLVDVSLFGTVPKCSIFVEGHDRSKPLRAKQSSDLLVQMLEVMHQDESKIFVGMLKKKLKVKGLTSKLVLEVFPNLYQKV
tara:strand:- start:344 stop:778 length:435 start_codon:yes stop_codon:yes gene_type:complete